MQRVIKMQKFVESFKKSQMWAAMAKTKEDSPWHREESVCHHTEMVLAEFDKLQATYTMSINTMIVTYISLLFHDVGKPPCKVVKFKESRGHYNAFHGHETKSARMFEDYYVSNYKMFKDWLDVEDAYKVMWMIENHLPYDVIGNDKKMDYLRTAMHGNLGNAMSGFGWHLLSDTFGRISDDAAEKRAKTTSFVEMLGAACINECRHIKVNAPTVTMLIGASGSGKSTHVKSLVEKGFAHYSFDDIRIEVAARAGVQAGVDDAGTYRNAFAYCDKHRSEFGHYADVEYIKLIKDYKSIVVDNTNTSRKTRTKFLVEAKKRGYRLEAVMFPVSKTQLIERMEARTDKQVPEDAVLRQYDFISIPWVGVEVDAMHIVDTNLVKK